MPQHQYEEGVWKDLSQAVDDKHVAWGRVTECGAPKSFGDARDEIDGVLLSLADVLEPVRVPGLRNQAREWLRKLDWKRAEG